MNRTKAIRNLSLSLLLATGIYAAPAFAQINFNINVAPPAAQYEAMPVVSHGNVWAPGYWGWTGERYTWVRGRTIVQREGYRWAPDRWDQRNNLYYRTSGHWVQDHSYKPVKMKKEKKQKHWKNDDRGEGNHGRGHGKGGKHGD